MTHSCGTSYEKKELYISLTLLRRIPSKSEPLRVFKVDFLARLRFVFARKNILTFRRRNFRERKNVDLVWRIKTPRIFWVTKRHHLRVVFGTCRFSPDSSEKVDKTSESGNLEKGWGKGARVAPTDDFFFYWLKSTDIFNR